MAQLTKEVCGNCGGQGCVLFCDNEFTDFLCKKCGATNLLCVLPKLESTTPCKKEGDRHDLRISKQGLFCPKCYTVFNQDGTECDTKEADGQ